MARKITSSDYVLNNNGDPYNNGEDQPNAGPVQGYDPSQGGIDANPPTDLGGIDANPETGGLGPELGPPVDQGTGWQGNEGQTGDPTGTGKTPVTPLPDVPHTPTTPVTPDNGLPANGDLGPLIAGRLKDLFGQSLTPDMNDPQLQSARLQNQRNFEDQRQLLAERAGVEGFGNSGGLDTGILGLKQGQGAADLGAVANLGKDRQANILQALGLASQNQQGNNQLGLSYAQLQALLNSQALQNLLAGTGA